MKEFMKEVRMFIVTLLGFTAFLCIASEPIDESRWFQTMFWQVVSAVCFGATSYFLYEYWNRRGLLPEDLDEKEVKHGTNQ